MLIYNEYVILLLVWLVAPLFLKINYEVNPALFLLLTLPYLILMWTIFLIAWLTFHLSDIMHKSVYGINLRGKPRGFFKNSK